MKQKSSFEPHLAIKRFTLLPGREWNFHPETWSFVQVTAGVGYWLHPRTNHDLETGSVLVLSENARGMLRASQLGELHLHFFEVRPERLSGLVTFGEQRFLQDLAAQDQFTVRYFPPRALLSEKFKQLCEHVNDSTFCFRWHLLDVFAQAFGEHLANRTNHDDALTDARARLLKMLGDLPASDLLDLDFTELVRQMGCTPRHLSRVFREVVGTSFREKQAQVRLSRAQELLATTQSKVVEVALESGYQSLSLFNLMFKRRFGVSPARYREQARKPRPTNASKSALRILRA
jgi:AraC-like DNA-binding protein